MKLTRHHRSPRRAARVSIAALSVAAVCLVAACSSNSDADADAGASAKPKDKPVVRFLYSPYADYAAFFIAEDRGYFDDLGLDVQLQQKGGASADTVQLVAAGNIETGGISWSSGVFNASDRGASIDVLSEISRIPASGRDPSPFMVSAKAYADGIRKVADLKGKKVGVPGPGGFGAYSVAKSLGTGGLTLKDVQLVNLGPADVAAAFENGSIQAAWTIEPFSTQLAEKGIGKNLVEFAAANTELGFLGANADWVKKNKETATKFVAGFLKGVADLDAKGFDDPQVRDIVAKYTKMPADLLDHIAYSDHSKDGSLDEASIAEQEDFFRQQGDLLYKGKFDLDSVYKRDILDAARAMAAK